MAFCEIHIFKLTNSLEVNFAVVVGIVHAEDVLLQLVCVCARVALPHHGGEIFPVNLSELLARCGAVYF